MRKAAMVAAGIAVGGLACNALLDFESFSIAPVDGGRSEAGVEAGPSTSDAATDATSNVDGGCIDPTGFSGRGCYRCTPTTNEQLLGACTTAIAEPFDNGKRIIGFDSANPRPPLADGGPNPPDFDAGAAAVTDSGTPDFPDCDLSDPRSVLVLGATGFPMNAIAQAMGAEARIFYAERGSCDGVATMILGSPKLGDPGASTKTVTTYDGASGAARRCNLADVHPADIALSGLFASSCRNQSGLGAEDVVLPADVQDFLGPVNPVMFAVPATSPERVISAEAAYRVYGLGAGSGVDPWTDESFIFKRRPSSANQQTVALTLGMPVDALRGRDSNGSSNMRVALQTSTDPAKTIGLSSSEIVDVNRNVMKALAYQHYGQPVGFYPDSDPGTLNRRNVRDGHYFMWIPLHALVRTVAGDPAAATNGTFTDRALRDAAVKRLLFVMVSRQAAPVPSVDLFGALKTLGNVPQCAMRVTRAREGAPLQPFTPSVSCDCGFEAATPGATRADCRSCRDASECNPDRPTCSFGFCE